MRKVGSLGSMNPGPGEPVAGPWQAETFTTVVEALLDGAPVTPPGRPRVIAVDGRGGAGKTTFARRLREAIPGAEIVHTDDVAWWHSRFGWAQEMIDGILTPLRAGQDVSYMPPGWAAHGRTGEIVVPAAVPVVIIEGVGASRRELARLIDAAVWVQSDFGEARERGLRRDRAERPDLDEAKAAHEWDEWMAEEIPFLLADRPWRRADLIVSGGADGDEILVA
jgi:uridine kinase